MLTILMSGSVPELALLAHVFPRHDAEPDRPLLQRSLEIGTVGTKVAPSAGSSPKP
jgi:hypothetical protein